MTSFFSIGVTTFNRPKLLKECLVSIINQSFGDFEIIVGNDYQGEIVTGESLGIVDSRITFVNYPENVGPIRNANNLLALSKGRYFTWLADDDVYDLDFLQSVQNVFAGSSQCPCVFTSYRHGTEYIPKAAKTCSKAEFFEGAEFLKRYLAREIRTLGCYAVFEVGYIRQLGGMKPLGRGRFSPYADNLLVIQSGMLSRVAFISEELVFYRTHSGSVSTSSGDVDVYIRAQQDFISESIPVLLSLQLQADFTSNLFALMKWCIRDFHSIVRRAGALRPKQAVDCLVLHARILKSLWGTSRFASAMMLFLKLSFSMVSILLRGEAVRKS